MAVQKVVEPNASEINELLSSSNAILSRYLNWYNYEKDQSDAYAYLKEFVKQHRQSDIKAFGRVSEKVVKTTYGWLARLHTQGATLKPYSIVKINQHIDQLLNDVNSRKEETDEVVEEVKRPSIQDAMLNKQKEFLGELSNQLDVFIANGCKSTGFDLYKYMQGQNSPKVFGNAVGSLFDPMIDELNDINNNEQLQEAYSCYTNSQVKKIAEWCQKQIDDGQRYADFKKANRKPKARKAKPPIKQVEKLKYLKEFAELKLTSIGATTIIGAQQLWVYNVKYRRLGCYYASGSSGFSVKGTSLQGWDPETSIWKTLRKPEVTIPLVLDQGKIALRKLLSDLTTSENKLNGRINEEVILLRVL